MRALTASTLDQINGSAPPALVDRRRSAFEVFERSSMPTSKDENWKYVELDLDLDDLALPAGPGERLADDDFISAVSDAAGRAVLVDGFLVESDHDTGAEFGSAVEAWSRRTLPGMIDATADKYAAAALAFAGDGVSLRVPAGVSVDQPFLVDVQAVTPGAVSFPSITIEVEENAEASVLVVLRSPGDTEVTLVPQVAVRVGDGARLGVTTAQVLGHGATSVSHHRVETGRDATIRLGEVGLGARFARLDLGIRLAGTGGSAEVVGIYFGERDQVLDYRMVIEHVGPNTTSDVFLKGAVEDEAQSVFTGLLRIEEDARRVSAFETNRNLVLSEGAKAHSVPNLEILCNDVICGHGSSVGPLEEDHLYYLMSRGLGRERAERVLIRGFFEEVIRRLPGTRLAAPIRSAVDRRFTIAQAEGRVR
ncbi:MAG: Fe-S cluster assembly protein SufD [Acidimicrobiia bacterium]